jgi:Tol biopolymer transport system component
MPSRCPASRTSGEAEGTTCRRVDSRSSRSLPKLVVANPDGTHERQVTHPKRGVLTWQQDWSPNGRWIAYQREGGPGPFDDIFKIRANGKDKTYLSDRLVLMTSNPPPD